MKSVNKVILLGNVTRDPELKTTTTGQSVCTFGMATNRVWRDANGDKQSLPEYHNLVAWSGLAEFCAQSITKGKPIYVEGYLKTRSWDSPEGAKIFRTEVVVENLVLLGKRGDGDFDEDVLDAAPEMTPETADANDPLPTAEEVPVMSD